MDDRTQIDLFCDVDRLVDKLDKDELLIVEQYIKNLLSARPEEE